MIEQWKVTIPSLSGKKQRRAYAYLPESYAFGGKNYPVIYMFDGQNLFFDEHATFGKSWGLGKYLDYTETQVIVVAVECNDEGDCRLQEYSPYDFTFGEKVIKGKGRRYMNWLITQLKPYIDAKYRTDASRNATAVAGSSMGGLMALYALSAYNKYFSKCAALSPSLWIYESEVPQFIEQAKYNKNTVAYMDCGSKEFKNHLPQLKAFANVSKVLIEKEVNLTARIVPNGTHCEKSWEEQIPFFMNALGFEAKN